MVASIVPAVRMVILNYGTGFPANVLPRSIGRMTERKYLPSLLQETANTFSRPAKTLSSNSGNCLRPVVSSRTLAPGPWANKYTVPRPCSITPRITFSSRTRRQLRSARGTHAMRRDRICSRWVTMEWCDTSAMPRPRRRS
uniref:Uncharacterized protein n=1 Tax=Cacopsylla melanoneura TaxID=428564 RepID=A0A8D9AK34_9HEMI